MTNTITWFDCPICGYTARMERINPHIVYCSCVCCGWPVKQNNDNDVKDMLRQGRDNRTWYLFDNVPASQMLLLVILAYLSLC